MKKRGPEYSDAHNFIREIALPDTPVYPLSLNKSMASIHQEVLNGRKEVDEFGYKTLKVRQSDNG